MKKFAAFAILVAYLVQVSHQVDYKNPVRSAADDEIKNLPGLSGTINFKQYAGYLNADDKNDKFFHYWFVESQSKPAEDPLVLWLTGGPGCSSLDALFTELGPFKVDNEGETLSMNENSWNKVANVIFLESPSGVGFSYAKTDARSTDDSTSLENYMALKSFLRKFPQYANSSLYLTGESYAGVYLPTLGVRVDADKDMNLKGIAIGNGYLDTHTLTESLVFFSYHHGLVGASTWEKISKDCCRGLAPERDHCSLHSPSGFCRVAVNEALSPLYDGLNPYNIYANCESVSSLRGKLTRDIVGKRLLRAATTGAGPNTKLELHVGAEPTCTDSLNVANYLNQASVRTAIHVPKRVKSWDVCSNIDYVMDYALREGGLKPQIETLINSTRNLNLLIYNGDVDSVCNFLGDEWFTDNLGRPVTKDYAKWYVDGQIAGFTKEYSGITFTTVRGSGHMVPGDRPAEALQMLRNFFSKSEK